MHRHRIALALGLFVILGALSAGAQPYRPSDDSEVLERLPRSSSGGDLQDLRDLRQRLAQDPRNLALATEFAHRAISVGRSASDPRYYGYAQAALAPWWDLPHPPLDVLLLRANIRQNRHDFEAAVQDLNAALAQQPAHAGAWMTRAIVLLVQGKPREALESCRALAHLDRFSAAACAGTVAGSSGEAEQGYALLVRALVEFPQAPPEMQRWALTSLAEIAARLGWVGRAEAHFQDALSLEDAQDSDIYLRAAYADFLLDLDRPGEVLDFLEGEEQSDALLLRRALAAHRLQDRSAASLRQRLADRYAAAHLRGTNLHLGLEARFALELEDDPPRALRLALENWQSQREPVDARIVLAAARAAGDRDAAAPVRQWIEETGIQDVRLNALMTAPDTTETTEPTREGATS